MTVGNVVPAGPGQGARCLFERTGWNTRLTDLFEINEAFAVVAMAAIDDLKLDYERVNVNGGPAHWAIRSEHRALASL